MSNTYTFTKMPLQTREIFKEVRKFSLAYNDFPTMLSNITLFLRTLSLNVDPRNQTQIPKIYTILNFAFAASYCYVYLVSAIWFVFWRCTETGDILSALTIFSLATGTQIGLYKIIFMFYYRSKLTYLVGQCLDSFALAQPGSRFYVNLSKSLKIVKRRAMVFWFVIMGNGLLYILKPIVLPGRHLMEDVFIFLGLEPMIKTPNYEIALILTAMSVFVAVYFPSNATAFQIITTGYIEAQMLAWSKELKNLWKDACEHYIQYKQIQSNDVISNCTLTDKDIFINEYVNLHLKDIIKAHAINLHLFIAVENIFTGAIAAEFSLLMVGLIAELVAGLENTYLAVPFALMQGGMDCFTGQKLIDASMMFEKAVYHCNWENFSKENMKSVQIMLMMSQKTMILSAGGIAKLNYVCFLTILKTIYSAYTTLSATMN